MLGFFFGFVQVESVCKEGIFDLGCLVTVALLFFKKSQPVLMLALLGCETQMK